MKVLITGAQGQLGRELIEKLQKNSTLMVYGFNSEKLNITDQAAVSAVIGQLRPALIINAAAFTDVDACETNYQMAYKVNVSGPRNLARAANSIGARLIHISTDFVFDGKKTSPYFEYDATNPLSVYGKTKLAGEHAITQQTSEFFILRTSWLYGKYGKNFVKTMFRLGKTNDCLSVVTDQIGSPTCVTDLVETIVRVMATEEYGIYNFSNSGCCSWNQFAREIFRLLDMPVKVQDTTGIELNRLAIRPAYSVMDTKLIQSAFSITSQQWNISLQKFIYENRHLFSI